MPCTQSVVCEFTATNVSLDKPEQLFLTQLTGDSAIDADLKYLRELPWASSSIECISLWPRELFVLLNLAMLSPQPQLFLLGPDSIIVYNTAYGRLLYDHHPLYQGRPIGTNEALIARTQNIERIVDRAKQKTAPANENHVPFFFLNQGRLEEVFLSATMVQLPPPLSGYHASTYNTTPAAVQTRRKAAYDAISSACTSAKSLPVLWDAMLKAISEHDGDISFAILYRAGLDIKHDESAACAYHQVDTTVYTLHGIVGSFDSAPPRQIDMSSDDSLASCLRKAQTAHTPTHLSAQNGTLPKDWLQASRNRCYNDPCLDAVILTSASSETPGAQALLILGLAPRRPYDDEYKTWIGSINRLLTNCVTSITLAEARVLEKKMTLKRIEKEREIMQKELLLKEKESALATNKVRRTLEITQSVNVGIFECLPSGDILQANEAFHKLSGRLEHQNIHKRLKFFDLCHPEDAASVKLQRELLMAGQDVTFAMRFNTETSDGRWVQSACVPVLDDRKQVISITGCLSDITAQKQVEQEAVKRTEALQQLRLSESRLLKFTENAPLGIMVLDREMRPSFVNKAWRQLIHHPATELNQTDILSVIFAEDVELVGSSLEKVLETGQSAEFETRLSRTWSSEDGEIRGQVWVLVTAFAEIVDGSITQVMCAMADISHLKFSASLERTRLEEAIEAKRQQGNFIDMTSHEIRNPLSAVMHCADLISHTLGQTRTALGLSAATSQDNLTVNPSSVSTLLDTITDAVDTISLCSVHQKRITDDILCLSKLDSNLLEVCPSPFKVREFLDRIYETSKLDATRADVELKAECDASIDALGIDWIQTDPGCLMQVLVNLITNAIKFTKGETGPRRVIIRVGASRNSTMEVMNDLIMARTVDQEVGERHLRVQGAVYLWFTVNDTGCGMDAQGQARMFSRFSQASPKTYNKYGGSGLGLFISQKLVELQGGEIGFTSEANSGSTFAFFVKAHRANPTTDTEPTQQETLSPAKKSFAKKINVLLVEDNLINQKVLKKQLEIQGYSVCTADNGQEAFDFIKQSRHWKNMDRQKGTAPFNVDVM